MSLLGGRKTKSKSKAQKKKASDVALLRYATVIRSPVITEKATACNEHGQVIFKVAMDANKRAIRAAVESLFGVTVNKVNTLVMKGKRKRFRNIMGRRSDYKKAIVTLKKGQSIDLTAKIELK
ncbi:MAG: 50S ribosomal protein L23 [Alphaproteobacteria bacterium GM202ARS2]|nr:50S ribosomal protein L23 [Alphaproteobacteria bacterium GM202ARS2]